MVTEGLGNSLHSEAQIESLGKEECVIFRNAAAGWEKKLISNTPMAADTAE